MHRRSLGEQLGQTVVQTELLALTARGQARSVRSSQADTWATGASSSASPSGLLSAISTTLRPSAFVGHTRTSPCPQGRKTPSTSRSRAKVQCTGRSELMWKVMWTAYGSSVR